VELAARHEGDAGGQRDERPDHGQQARNENGLLSPTIEAPGYLPLACQIDPGD